MFANLRRRRNFIVALASFGATLIFVAVFASHSRADPPSDVSQLQQQRIETLRKASTLAHTLSEKGVMTMGEAFRIDRLLLDAQLESAGSASDRAKLLQNAIDIARKQEEFADKQQQAGYVTSVVPLEAKAERLHLEIQLAQLVGK